MILNLGHFYGIYIYDDISHRLAATSREAALFFSASVMCRHNDHLYLEYGIDSSIRELIYASTPIHEHIFFYNKRACYVNMRERALMNANRYSRT